jgi:FtsH-binding integral membrane protein
MKKFIASNWLALASIVMIAGTFGSFPYVYNQLTNWVVAIAALTIAYAAKKSGQKTYMRLFVAAAVILNPIAPIYLTADQWRAAYIAALLLMAISMFKVRKNS